MGILFSGNNTCSTVVGQLVRGSHSPLDVIDECYTKHSTILPPGSLSINTNEITLLRQSYAFLHNHITIKGRFKAD